MKILYIAKFKNIWDEEIIAQAFERNGVEVIRMEERDFDLLKALDIAKKVDLVLIAKFNVPGDRNTFFAECKKIGVKTASWTFDLLIGHPPREAVLDSFFWLSADYVFLTDGGHDKEYKKRGVNNITVRQGIAKEYAYYNLKEEVNDIVFVGTYNPTYPYRQRTMKFLKSVYGDRFRWVGEKDSYESRGHDLNELVASTKIMIGCSMYSDDYWSNRIYELVGRGAFLITPRVRGLEKEFEYFKEIVPYDINDFSGLEQKINYFLENKKERDQIRMAGFEKVKNNYLYDDRVKQIIYEVNK